MLPKVPMTAYWQPLEPISRDQKGLTIITSPGGMTRARREIAEASLGTATPPPLFPVIPAALMGSEMVQSAQKTEVAE
jgi:hypothetical protein